MNPVIRFAITNNTCSYGCMCACVCVCMHVCVCACAHIHMHMHTYIYSYIHVPTLRKSQCVAPSAPKVAVSAPKSRILSHRALDFVLDARLCYLTRVYFVAGRAFCFRTRVYFVFERAFICV